MLNDTAELSALIPGALFFGFWAASAVRVRTLKRDPNFLDDRLLRFFLFGWASTVAICAAAIGATIAAAVLKPIAKPAEEFVLSPYVGIAVVLGGALGFFLKRRVQIVYGLVEAAAALGVIAYVSFTEQSLGPKATACVTALYFLVRGLDNLTDSPQVRDLAQRLGLQKR